MYRGTTPSLKLTLNTTLDLNELKAVWITIKCGNTMLTRELQDVEVNAEEKTFYIELTQEETLKFASGVVKIQARLLMNDEKAYATNMQEIEINNVLKGGVISE